MRIVSDVDEELPVESRRLDPAMEDGDRAAAIKHRVGMDQQLQSEPVQSIY